MRADRISEAAVTADTEADAHPELGEAERLGLLVGAAYGNALADRDAARAMAVALEQQVAELTDAAEGVLAMDAVAHPTFAHDDNAAERLRAVVAAVRSTQAPETSEDTR